MFYIFGRRFEFWIMILFCNIELNFDTLTSYGSAPFSCIFSFSSKSAITLVWPTPLITTSSSTSCCHYVRNPDEFGSWKEFLKDTFLVSIHQTRTSLAFFRWIFNKLLTKNEFLFLFIVVWPNNKRTLDSGMPIERYLYSMQGCIISTL